MKRAARVGIGGALVVASIVAMGVLTRYDYRAGTDAAALRLAWRTPVPRVVECREPTAEELAELPIHMRREEICEGRTLRYRLEVTVDGAVRYRSTVGAAGARGDRPIHVFEELRLEPGTRHVRIVFERTDSVAEGDDASVPARLVADRRLQVHARDVVLITYDADSRRLAVRDPGA